MASVPVPTVRWLAAFRQDCIDEGFSGPEISALLPVALEAIIKDDGQLITVNSPRSED